MGIGRRTLYVVCIVVAAVAIGDAIRRLLTGDYLFWTLEIVVGIAVALVAHRLRAGRGSSAPPRHLGRDD